jgi:hypothetical protein
MNERIRQLATKSELELTIETKKFAELIVRECAEVCYDHSNAAGGVDTHFGYGYKDCGDDIKRNFGVEL